MHRRPRMLVPSSLDADRLPRTRGIRPWLPATAVLLAVVAAVTVSACATGASQTTNPLPPPTYHRPPTNHNRPPTIYHHPPTKPNPCARNTHARAVLVSIRRRRLWACARSRDRYEVSVITGMEKIPADLTPTGVYRIYAKQTNLYLSCSDRTGSWHDWVHFWMPFLTNRYGIYGLHDATWRRPGAFGVISPYSTHASHGCAELPLHAATWLYNWAHVGTTVIVVD